MLKKRRDGIYISTLLQDVWGLTHGFSTRIFGDMKKNRTNRKEFALRLAMVHEISLTQQVHGSRVAIVGETNTQKIVKNADGLVTKVSIPIGVVSADCVPMLCVDPKAHIVGAVHASWRGTVGRIVSQAVQTMKKLGARAENILVAIGPHIGMCCYDVPEERAIAFTGRFGTDEKMAFKVDGVWHLDLGYANYLQLIACGVLPEHIDAPITCTSCQNSEFFSYRKDTKEAYGEMMAAIAFNE